jgi:membrane-associated phospholipid phosphatase
MTKLILKTILFILPYLNILGLQAQKNYIEKTGDVFQIAIPAAAFASTLIWQSNDKPHWQFCKSMALSVISTHTLKRLIDKERPNGGRYSFPSGHTTAAFTGAAFLQKRYGWRVGIPSYLAASFVGWSRVYANKHDYWDVLGGTILGISCSYVLTKRLADEKFAVSIGRQNSVNTLNLAITF